MEKDLFKIIGIELVDYTSKKTGNRVNGYRLHMTFTNNNTEGFACISEFVKSGVAEGVQVGDTVELLYNKFGQVSKINTIAF